MALPRRTALATMLLFLLALGMTYYGAERIFKGSESVAHASSAELKIDPQPKLVSTHKSSELIEINAPIKHPPSLFNSALYVTSRDGYLRTFDLNPIKSGSDKPQAIWEIKLGRYGDILSSPSFGEGHIFVTNLRGELYKISQKGNLIWKRTIGKNEKFPPLFVPKNENNEACILTISESELKKYSAESGGFLSNHKLNSPLATALIHFGDTFVGATVDGKIIGLNSQSLEEIWSQKLESSVNSINTYKNIVLVTTEAHQSSAYNPSNGEKLWSLSDVKLIPNLPYHEGSLVLATKGQEKLIQINPQLGTEVSEAPLNPVLSLKHPVQVGKTLFFSTDSGFLGKLNSSGEIYWRSPNSKGEVQNWIADKDYLVGNTQKGRLVIFRISKS